MKMTVCSMELKKETQIIDLKIMIHKKKSVSRYISTKIESIKVKTLGREDSSVRKVRTTHVRAPEFYSQHHLKSQACRCVHVILVSTGRWGGQ